MYLLLISIKLYLQNNQLFFYLRCVITILINDSIALELITNIIVKTKNSGKYLTKKLFTYWLTS